jgi:hypothetical protein
MLTWALMYARRGWAVIPLHASLPKGCSCGDPECSSVGKHPMTKNGAKDATTDVAQIRRWWTKRPYANIGIATGPVSGLYVIDVDCDKGGEIESLEPYNLSEIMDTASVRTGGGGYHFYLKCAEPLPNTGNKLATHVDTRGLNGYVVAPPSRTAKGEYAWETRDQETLEPIEPVEMPPELLAALTSSARHAHPRKEEQHARGVDGQQEHKPSVAQEQRNNYLTSKAGQLCHLGLSQVSVEACLRAINETRYGGGAHPDGSLTAQELEKTVFKSIPKWQLATSGSVQEEPLIEMMDEVMNDTDPPRVRWIIPDLLSEGLCLLSGKPKSGKSWLVFATLITCALGSEVGGLVLGRYPVKPMGVLYLSLEDTPARFYERGVKLLAGRPAPANFGRALSWSPLLSGGLHALETHLIEHPEIQLVAIDTLARVRKAGSGNGNMYQEDSDLMGELQNLTKRHHIALIVVHHLRKMVSSDVFDEVSGSTGMTSTNDNNFVLKRERNQNDGMLSVTGRSGKEEVLAITFDPATCQWSVTGKAAEREVSQGKQEIIDLLKKHGTMSNSEIAQAVEKPRTTLNTFLSRMVQEGLIVKDGYGLYTLKQGKEDQVWDSEALFGDEEM